MNLNLRRRFYWSKFSDDLIGPNFALKCKVPKQKTNMMTHFFKWKKTNSFLIQLLLSYRFLISIKKQFQCDFGQTSKLVFIKQWQWYQKNVKTSISYFKRRSIKLTNFKLIFLFINEKKKIENNLWLTRSGLNKLDFSLLVKKIGLLVC